MYYDQQALIAAYAGGLIGATCSPAATARLLKTLPLPLFGDTLAGTGKDGVFLGFTAVVYYEGNAGRESYDEVQVTGDCVSHATRNAIDIARANDPDIQATEDYVDRSATEGLYGSRGHSGEGAVCSDIVGWAHRTGGVLLRKEYPQLKLDLREYDATIGVNWGSRGVPDLVEEEASHHKVGTISLVNNWEQARDCIANGFGLVCCSGQGFSRTRDADGLASPSGRWGHAMAWTAVDSTRSGDCRFLVQNSWGKWNEGGKSHSQPDGSFWIQQSVASSMIASGGTWAISNVAGFPKRRLRNWGAKEVLG